MGEDKEKGTGGEGGKPDKPKEKKTVEVTVLRAVDRYKYRGRRITVPNDSYHKGLIKQGNLRLESEG